MNTRLFSVSIFLCINMLLFSCKKGVDTLTPLPVDVPGFAIPGSTPVTGRVSGIVVDELNNPVPNAAVVLSGITYQTDNKGFFHINNVSLDKYVTTVTVSKAGYFKAFRSFSATASRNNLSIKLLPKTLAGTVDAAAGGNISLANGTAVTFPQNGIVVKSSGAAYTGTVNVYASYIDPTGSDFASAVPGSMMGKDTARMYVLQSAGMIAVDLESPGGQALQLAPGKNAAVKMAIPASLLGKAPASIDTWSLDDKGIWVREGTAARNGGFYDLTVSHFSFWNCDVPANAVYLTIHVKDQNNQSLPNALVQLTIPNNNTWWATTHGFTDSTGTVAGLVPSNLGLQMNISANVFTCSNPLSTQNIGPFSSDTTINITVTINTSQQVTISGSVNDCNGQPIQAGTASILVGSYNYYTTPVVNGNYSITLPFCTGASNATIWLIDNTTGAYAGPVAVSISGNTVSVPTQVACGTAQGALFNLAGCGIYGTYTTGIPLNTSNYMLAIVNVQAPGTYNIVSTLVNGIQFALTGTFTQIGLDTLLIPGSGMPVNNGNFTITITPGSGQPCSSVLTVGSNIPAAVFSLGSGGACSNLVIAGNYVVNFPLNQTNFVTLSVNVTSPGSYNIITNSPQNGMSFSGTGVFTNIGQQAVALTASGVPAAAGTSTFVAMANGVAGCSFDIIATTTGSAAYTFTGAPGNCAGATIAGTYLAGIPLLGQNTVALVVNVSSAGAYSITSNTVNGFGFSGSGVFSTVGVQTILLTASGTPQAAGNYTFNANGGSAQSCAFVVTCN